MKGDITMSDKNMVLAMQDGETAEAAIVTTITTITITTTSWGLSTASNNCDNG